MALRFQIVDKPNIERKIHSKPIPLMGGLAIFISFFLVLFIFKEHLVAGDLNYHHWLGFFVGAIFLLIGGILDDKYNLAPIWQLIGPILAIIAVIGGGVRIEEVSHPLGGFIPFSWGLSSLIIFIWLLGMIYTTKLLDGLDGLASGVSAIGALIIFLFTISTKYYQADLALASLAFFAVLLGFLVFNFNPAKIFLGESGSVLLGYILGVLAIISGGKIAIALLVLGLPVLDLLWTIIRRLWAGKNPFRSADRKHLHHRLLDLGLSQRKAVLFFYLVAAFFGFSALLLQSQGKLLALGALALLMLVLVIFFYFQDRKKVLVHICCAPCGDYLLSDILMKKYEPVLYFYNPNIDSYEEYERRLQGVKKLAEDYNLKLIIEAYNHKVWLEMIKGLEQEPERGSRCWLCYHDRLEKTAQIAKQNGIDNFYTTLVTSVYKDLGRIKEFGQSIALEHGLNFLEIDFDRQDLFKKSVERSKEKEYYRQKYCGCEF